MKNTKTLKIVAALLMTVILSACGGGGSADSKTAAPVTDADLFSPVDPTNPNSPTTGTVTYYTKTITDAPINGWSTHTVTMKGMCVLYSSKTYCWDDGAILLPSWVNNNFTYGGQRYAFWRMAYSVSNGALAYNCYGGNACSGDAVTAPTLMSSSVLNNVAVAKVNDVFATGTPKTVTCTKTGSTLNCVDFTIDLAQLSL